MATLKQGILGGVKGKVGSVVGSSWKGIATLRALPLSVTNPRTTAQVENRDRFSALIALATVILSALIKPLNDRFASAMSGYNLFVQRSKDAFLGDGTFVPANVILSRGKLGSTAISSVAATVDGEIEIQWSTDLSNGYQAATDKAYILVCDSVGNVIGMSSGSYNRVAGASVVVTSRDLVAQEHVFCYLSFLRADGTLVGDSEMKMVIV